MKHSQVYQESGDGHFTHNGTKYSLNKALSIAHTKPTTTVKTADLSWILEYSFGEIAGKNVCYSCRKGPADWHDQRVEKADLSTPILVTQEAERVVALDGLHRLIKAVNQGIKELPAKWLTSEELAVCLHSYPTPTQFEIMPGVNL